VWITAVGKFDQVNIIGIEVWIIGCIDNLWIGKNDVLGKTPLLVIYELKIIVIT